MSGKSASWAILWCYLRWHMPIWGKICHFEPKYMPIFGTNSRKLIHSPQTCTNREMRSGKVPRLGFIFPDLPIVVKISKKSRKNLIKHTMIVCCIIRLNCEIFWFHFRFCFFPKSPILVSSRTNSRINTRSFRQPLLLVSKISLLWFVSQSVSRNFEIFENEPDYGWSSSRDLKQAKNFYYQLMNQLFQISSKIRKFHQKLKKYWKLGNFGTNSSPNNWLIRQKRIFVFKKTVKVSFIWLIQQTKIQ